MGHFAVAVFTSDENQSIHDLLTPHGQNVEVKPYVYVARAQLDSYEIGGHWKDWLILKNKGEIFARLKTKTCDAAFVRDINFEAMRRRKTAFSTYDVITPDGIWHAIGEMDSRCISPTAPEDEDAWEIHYYDRFIKPALDNNCYLTVVDCHI